MNILGHMGLTLGSGYFAVYVADALSAGKYLGGSSRLRWLRPSPAKAQGGPPAARGAALDFRVMLVGSVLPDLIDKPLGIWILPGVVSASRSVGHSLVFNLGLLLVSLLLLRLTNSYRFLVLALACIGHLILDQVWFSPNRLLWPFWQGISPIDQRKIFAWFSFELPDVGVHLLEAGGVALLLWFAVSIIRRRNLRRFLTGGGLK